MPLPLIFSTKLALFSSYFDTIWEAIVFISQLLCQLERLILLTMRCLCLFRKQQNTYSLILSLTCLLYYLQTLEAYYYHGKMRVCLLNLLTQLKHSHKILLWPLICLSARQGKKQTWHCPALLGL